MGFNFFDFLLEPYLELGSCFFYTSAAMVRVSTNHGFLPGNGKFPTVLYLTPRKIGDQFILSIFLQFH